MDPLFTFILGLLVGWLIEWLIDYFYWRRRYAERQVESPAEQASRNRSSRAGDVDPQPAGKIIPDDLKVIKGIGPVIERKLNEAGIHTFEQLGNLSVAGLRRILGDVIERLADEEGLLRQARDLARRK
jgi:predicted flap endonuclease-1-like 5' DNA nuclease